MYLHVQFSNRALWIEAVVNMGNNNVQTAQTLAHLKSLKHNQNPFCLIPLFIKWRNLYRFDRMWIVKVWEFHYWLLLSLSINFGIRAVYKCVVFYCRCWCIVRYHIICMDWINWTEHVALLYCIAITNYWKPHIVWSFLVHQWDDWYTKCTEHLYTLL